MWAPRIVPVDPSEWCSPWLAVRLTHALRSACLEAARLSAALSPPVFCPERQCLGLLGLLALFLQLGGWPDSTCFPSEAGTSFQADSWAGWGPVLFPLHQGSLFFIADTQRLENCFIYFILLFFGCRWEGKSALCYFILARCNIKNRYKVASKIAMGPMRILTPFQLWCLGGRAHVAFSWVSIKGIHVFREEDGDRASEKGPVGKRRAGSEILRAW